MGYTGRGTAGYTFTGRGNTSGPTFLAIGSESGLTDHGILLAQGNDAFVASNALTNGQLLIGSTGNDPVVANLTAGTGVTITNGSGTITIAATTAGFAWTDVTSATQALAVQNGYLTDRGAGVTYTLPASAASIGDTIIIVGKLGLTTIAQNAGQQILISSSSSTVGVGGSVAGTNVGDCITLVCITSGTSSVWRASSLVGNWTVV